MIEDRAQSPECRLKKFIFCYLLSIFYILFSVSDIQATTFHQGKIKAIEVEGLKRIDRQLLIDMIGLKIGDTINPGALRDGIKRAFKKGVFLDIKADVSPFDDGIKLIYIVTEVLRIKKINIAGNDNIANRKIRDALLFKKGEEFREEFLDNAIGDLVQFYRSKGFLEAAISISAKEDIEPGWVNLFVEIKEGSPLIVQKITILEEVRDMVKISEGDILDIGRVDKDIKRIREYYEEHGYINPVVGPYEFKDGELFIPVVPGYMLNIAFEGNTIFSSKRLLEEMPFKEARDVNEGIIEEASRRILRLYRQKGYNAAQVIAGLEKKDDLTALTFFIYEGQEIVLREIKFTGIGYPPEAIKEIMSLKEGDSFDEYLIENDREAIIAFYNAFGYLKAEIKEFKKLISKDTNEAILEITVYEGPQTRLEKIDIVGNKFIETEKIKKVLQLREASPYNDVDVADARYRVLDLYGRYGYIDAHVDVESRIDVDKAFITYKITEGKQYFMGKLIIRGNEKTKDEVVSREFVLKEGKPYSSESLLKSKERLHRLGLFSDISFESFPAEDNVKDVVVSLREGNFGAVEFGLGYGDYEGFRGFFDISYRNLWGYNRQIGLRAELSSIESRYILSYREPWFFGNPLPFKSYLTREHRRAINLDTRETLYVIDRLSLIFGIEKDLTERLKANLNYEYSLVKTTDVAPGVILTREDTGTLGIGSVSPSLFYDARDNPFDPTAGSLNGIILKFASKAFLSETEFLKAIFHSSWYFKIKKGLVLAISLRGGIAEGFGPSELPLIERFFLGGRTTVRGYDQDTLGPKGFDGNPTGGNAFALINAEVRASLGRGFGLVAFVDGGNVWHEIKDMETDLRYTTGLGLRYKTPVGPFRIDYGHKLNRQTGESPGELHFSLGHAF
ncbi:MAG: outer membrane protein assembly factor BamA [Nitrospirae bacterium]|nr:outer membrane protein assembly factor BamA [Nitrospirota bacterium]